MLGQGIYSVGLARNMLLGLPDDTTQRPTQRLENAHNNVTHGGDDGVCSQSRGTRFPLQAARRSQESETLSGEMGFPEPGFGGTPFLRRPFQTRNIRYHSVYCSYPVSSFFRVSEPGILAFKVCLCHPTGDRTAPSDIDGDIVLYGGSQNIF